MGPTTNELFWRKVDKTSDCWNRTAYRNKDGYGAFHGQMRKVKKAHRFAYELLVGKIPIGYELHHVWKNRACVRPDPKHVIATLPSEHSDRKRKTQTHCIHGHLFDEKNTGNYTNSDGYPMRICKTCTKIRDSAKAERRKLDVSQR